MAPKNHAANEVEQQTDSNGGALGGLRFVFSGGDITGRRSDWIELIESNGGVVSDSISMETDFLVVNASANLAETEFAANHGVPTIDESGLPVFLNNQGVEWEVTSE